MNVENPGCPSDLDAPARHPQDDDYTLEQAMRQHDGDSVALHSLAVEMLDRLIGRCSGQLRPRNPTSTPTGEAAERIQARQHHPVLVQSSVSARTTIAELRVLLLLNYSPLVRAGLDDPTADQRLDELAAIQETPVSDLAAGDRVRWRSTQADAVLARLRSGEAPDYPIERDGTLLADPSGAWVRIKYDDQAEADSALVETLTRIEGTR